MKQWLSELLSSNGKVSTKRVAYLTVVFASVGWMSTSLINTGITQNWVTAFQSLLAAVGAGYIGGVFAEKKDDTTPKE